MSFASFGTNARHAFPVDSMLGFDLSREDNDGGLRSVLNNSFNVGELSAAGELEESVAEDLVEAVAQFENLEPTYNDRSRKSRAWVGTWNNFQEIDYLTLLNDNQFKYIVIGREIAPTTGTPHMQLYFYTKQCKTWNSIHTKYPDMWFEPAKTTVAAIKYCKKCNNWEEKGDPPVTIREGSRRGGQKTKDNYIEAKTLAIAGNLDGIAADIYIKHYSSLKTIQRDHLALPADLDKPCGIWIYGPTGTGKSHKARVDYPNAYMKLPNKWWDGYQGQDSVLIDDFDISHACLGYHLKIWADRYSFSAEVKGSTIGIRPKFLIITSNYHPEEIWGDKPKSLEPILRRFSIIQLMNVFNLNERQPVVDQMLISTAPGFNRAELNASIV